jgi:mannose-6-phosphate isomerase-like protein (cupin superfamily)
MRIRLLAAVFPAVAAWGAEFQDVLKSAEIDAMLAGTIRDHPLLVRPNYAIWLKVHDGRPGALETHADADDILHIRKGQATITLGDRRHSVGPGDVVHIPRHTPHQIDPGRGRLEYVVVRIFPTGENLPPRQGFLAPRRMPDVLRKSEIDATIEKHTSNQPIHSGQAFTMNYVIYAGRPGPWEAHRGCVDIYFLQRGEGRAQLGGEITNAREESLGEIRGDGVKGAREYDIGPGDMVHIPRNGVHHVIPNTPKLAYLLLKVWAE